MKKLLFIMIFLFISLSASAKILDESIGVNPHALPGDSEKNLLMVQGVRLHEANDFYGRTDKLTTEAASLTVDGCLEHFSTSLSYKGKIPYAHSSPAQWQRKTQSSPSESMLSGKKLI